ncbi:hypothetical protein JTE90_010603 [Oedothorax gibbosus]|nr:hypothetical protein JTE90_010603 [Oedothorax gibbosus]
MKALFPELFHSRIPKIRPNDEQREQSQLFAEIKQLHHDLVCEGSESKLKEQIRNLLLDHDAAEINKLRAQLSATLEEARNQREQLIQEKEQLIQMHEQLIQMHEQLSFSLREHQQKLVKV